MIRLDAATVLLQWATGGMFFTWFTTRRREVGLGYGWIMRVTFGIMALVAAFLGFRFETVPGREIAAIATAVACFAALASSLLRRRAGVSGHRAAHDARSERIASMTGIERRADTAAEDAGPEFNPVLDLVPAVIGLVGIVIGAIDAGGNTAVSILRTVSGAAFIGSITDGMLLGHWYLVQPGLPRRLLNELVSALGWIWPVEVVAMLLPTGMISVWNGTVDDGWNGTLGWFWAACAITTIVLVFVTKAALRERAYSAVMAATGLLYLAILTAFGTDVVARAVLAA